MNYSKTAAWIAASVVAALPFNLPGEITLDVQADRLQTETPGQSASVSTLVLLVADTGADGFSPADSALTGTGFGLISEDANTLDGSTGNDLILWRGDLRLNEIDGVFSLQLPNLQYGNYGSTSWNEGQQLGLFWFPNLTVNSSQLTFGDAYGFFSQVESPDAGDIWISPPDTTFEWQLHGFSTNSLVLPTGAGTGTTDPASFVADQTVIPEPLAGPLLLALATIVLTACRRRRMRAE